MLTLRIKNGHVSRSDERFGSLENNSLVINNVQSSDPTKYFCNGKQVYLKVTTDPSVEGAQLAGDADTDQACESWCSCMCFSGASDRLHPESLL